MSILYHSGKVIVVVDALTTLCMGSTSYLMDFIEGVIAVTNGAESSLVSEMK